MTLMPPLLCDLCNRPIPPHAYYILKMQIYADPSMPPITTEDLEQLNLDQTMTNLLNQMSHMTQEELMDEVHRTFEFKLCRPCQIQFLANPLGKPRQTNPGKN